MFFRLLQSCQRNFGQYWLCWYNTDGSPLKQIKVFNTVRKLEAYGEDPGSSNS